MYYIISRINNSVGKKHNKTLTGVIDVVVLQNPRQSKVGNFDGVMITNENVSSSEVAVYEVHAFKVRHSVSNLQTTNHQPHASKLCAFVIQTRLLLNVNVAQYCSEHTQLQP